MKFRAAYLFLLTILQGAGTATLQAQEPAMKHFSVNDGLPSSTIYKSMQDRDGFLWFATDVGVSRFDGKTFVNFTSADGLSDNEIMDIKQDTAGRIWFLGFNGTLSFLYKHKFHNPDNDAMLRKVRKDGAFLHYYEDKHHRLWFASHTGFTVINGDKVSFLRAGLNGDAIVVSHETARGVWIFYGDTLRRERAGRFTPAITRYRKKYGAGFCVAGNAAWFVASQGIVRMKDTAQQLMIPFGKEFSETLQPDLMVSRDAHLWVSTSGKGVFRYDTGHITETPLNFLKNKNTSSLLEDHEHNIWIGTIGEGVYMLPSWYSTVTNYSTQDGLSGNDVECITKDPRGSIYAGLHDGNANIIEPDGIHILPYNKNSLKSNRLTHIQFQGGSCLLGSDRQLNYIDQNRKKDSIVQCRLSRRDSVHLIKAIKDISVRGDLAAIATSYSCFILKRQPNGRYEKFFRSISLDLGRTYSVFIDRDSTTWFSTIYGLGSYQNGQISAHQNEDPLLQNRIADIQAAKDGMLILACYGQGVLFYKDGRVRRHLTETDGLTSNVCRRLFIHNDDIYVATPRGATRITYVNGRILSVRKYTNADGLSSNDVNDIYADDNEICFATSEGVSILDVHGQPRRFVTPPLSITGISCNGLRLSADSSYQLDYLRNSFQFNFIGTSYQLPGEVIYRYRIRKNGGWKTTKSSSLDFPFLPPGEYAFQLQAKLKNSPWSAVKEFRFTILPPFWKTGWFEILVIAAGILLLVVLYIWRIRVIRKKRAGKLQLENQILHLEQQALQSAMNPHFIFNVMNSIQHYINVHDTHAANLYLSDFASLIRMNMDIASRSLITLDEEIVYLKLYLSLESLRLDNKLIYEIKVDEHLDQDETMIPVMMLQPFLENAIWHGIIPAKKQGRLLLQIREQNDELLQIRIIDNGIGISNAAGHHSANGKSHESKGMKLTKQRLELIGKMSGHELYVRLHDLGASNEETGTMVELILPANLGESTGP